MVSATFVHQHAFTREALVMNTLEAVFAGATGTFEFSGVLSLYQAAVPAEPSAAFY